VVGLIHEIPTAGEIIEGMVSEAKLIGERLKNMGILAERR
jgi:hypothetical protein